MILLTYFFFKNHLFFMGNPIITMPYTSSKMQTFYFIFKISPLTFSPLTFSILKVLFSTQAKMWEKNEQVHLLFWKYCFWPKPKCRRKINRYIYYFKNIVLRKMKRWIDPHRGLNQEPLGYGTSTLTTRPPHHVLQSI